MANQAAPRRFGTRACIIRLVRAFVAGCVLIAACSGGGAAGGGGAGSVAATVNGQRWQVLGQGSVLTTADGTTSLTILGFTPLPGSTKQADRSKPALEIVFSGVVPGAGSYDLATTAFLSVMYWPDQTHVYGAETGSLVISRITADHVDGTFDFTAILAPSGPDTVTVTDGSFSVPIASL
jgi:hypothetical protein